MGSVLSVAQRLGKSFIQAIVRVIDVKSPELHIAGNVNFGANHGTLNQQHFFQSWLDNTRPPAAEATALDQPGRQSEPSEMEIFCHVPAEVSSAIGSELRWRKQTGGQDSHRFNRSDKSEPDDAPNPKIPDDVACGSLDDRRPALPTPNGPLNETTECPEPPSKSREPTLTEPTDSQSASNWAVPATEIICADVLDFKKAGPDIEHGISRVVEERRNEARRRDTASSPKKSGIFSAITTVSLGKPKSHPMSTGKEEDTLLVDSLEKELKGVEAFAKQFAKEAVEWARLTSRGVGALRTWLVSLWKSISANDAESEAFEAFSYLVENRLLPLCVDIEAALNDQLLKGIAHILKTMNQPCKLLASLHEQEPVHYQYISSPPKSKRNKAYSTLQATSISYVALRAQLLNDLPQYIGLLHKSMTISVHRFAHIQARFWKDMSDQWGKFWEMLRVEGEVNAGFEETVNVWASRWTDVDEVVSSLNICLGSKVYQELERGRRRTASDFSDVSSSFPDASAWTSSPVARASRSRSQNSQKSSHRLYRGTPSHSTEGWQEPRRGRPSTPPAVPDSSFRRPPPPGTPGPANRGKLSVQMPSAPNGKPLHPSRKSKSHKSISSDKPRPHIPLSNQHIPSGDAKEWALEPAKYVCRAVHFFNPPAQAKTSYLDFPFFLLHVGVLYEILKEAGHPNIHSQLPLIVDGGEDCLLLCRNARGEVGWALASFLEPVSAPLSLAGM